MVKIFIVLLFSGFLAQAQKYGTAVGVRFGNNHYGVTVRQKIIGKTTLEGIVAAHSNEYNGTLLLQQHFPLIGKGFNIYAGGGMHIGDHKESGGYYGYDAVLGAELKLPALPVIISADVKPAYHVGHPDWFTFSTAISAHLIISKDSKKMRKKMRERKKRRKDRLKRREERKATDERPGPFPLDFFKKENKSNSDN